MILHKITSIVSLSHICSWNSSAVNGKKGDTPKKIPQRVINPVTKTERNHFPTHYTEKIPLKISLGQENHKTNGSSQSCMQQIKQKPTQY